MPKFTMNKIKIFQQRQAPTFLSVLCLIHFTLIPTLIPIKIHFRKHGLYCTEFLKILC